MPHVIGFCGHTFEVKATIDGRWSDDDAYLIDAKSYRPKASPLPLLLPPTHPLHIMAPDLRDARLCLTWAQQAALRVPHALGEEDVDPRARWSQRLPARPTRRVEALVRSYQDHYCGRGTAPPRKA